MLDKILGDAVFIKAMQRHAFEIISRLIELNIEFNIIVNTKFAEYEPQLPDDLNPNKNPFALFVLAGYTFESIELSADKIVFHAGYGPNDLDAYTSIDLGAITQIQIEGDIIFLNFSYYKRFEVDEDTQKAMNRFLNNPANKDSLKK